MHKPVLYIYRSFIYLFFFSCRTFQFQSKKNIHNTEHTYTSTIVRSFQLILTGHECRFRFASFIFLFKKKRKNKIKEIILPGCAMPFTNSDGLMV